MKKRRRQSAIHKEPAAPLTKLRERLAIAEETLRAIRNGEVDTVAVGGKKSRQVFTLEGAEQAYRVLVESMNEGAVTLTADKTILYANQCFARMVKAPLEQVTGGSFARFLTVAQQGILRPLLKNPSKTGAKIQSFLTAADGSQMPVQFSIRPVAGANGDGATIGMVVSDMTEAHRNQEMLRALAQRVVQAQEAERGRVALELHDHITQLLCAIAFESQALAAKLIDVKPAVGQAAIKISNMLGEASDEVERISRNLRPSLLDQLGLVAVLHSVTKEFQKRTGIPVEVKCTPLPVPLTPDTELTLYRILQEALNNVEKHARPALVSVKLGQDNTHVHLVISDDGIGFDSKAEASGAKNRPRLGLLGMRERAIYVRGMLSVKSARDAGTTVEVSIPLTPPETHAPVVVIPAPARTRKKPA